MYSIQCRENVLVKPINNKDSCFHPALWSVHKSTYFTMLKKGNIPSHPPPLNTDITYLIICQLIIPWAAFTKWAKMPYSQSSYMYIMLCRHIFSLFYYNLYFVRKKSIIIETSWDNKIKYCGELCWRMCGEIEGKKAGNPPVSNLRATDPNLFGLVWFMLDVPRPEDGNPDNLRGYSHLSSTWDRRDTIPRCTEITRTQSRDIQRSPGYNPEVYRAY